MFLELDKNKYVNINHIVRIETSIGMATTSGEDSYGLLTIFTTNGDIMLKYPTETQAINKMNRIILECERMRRDR
jgi:hypothetical protein